MEVFASVNRKKVFLYSREAAFYPTVMSDQQNEPKEHSAGAEYPPILDEITDEVREEVAESLKKERPLTGEGGERHDAWKREFLTRMFTDTSDVNVFRNIGLCVANTAVALQQGLEHGAGRVALFSAVVSGVAAVITGTAALKKKSDISSTEGMS